MDSHEKLFSTNDITEPESYIGVDESGKGDFFGPLVIAGFYVNSSIKDALIELGIKDSKKLSDKKISEIVNVIKSKFQNHYTIVQINPPKYNELYKKIGNLNRLLAWGHARCIENILQRHVVKVAICDQFGDKNFINNALMKEGKKIELIQTTNAERFLGVAAASMLARDAFINWIKRTEEKLSDRIPKGSGSEVKEKAKILCDRLGREELGNYVKLHFKIMDNL